MQTTGKFFFTFILGMSLFVFSACAENNEPKETIQNIKQAIENNDVNTFFIHVPEIFFEHYIMKVKQEIDRQIELALQSPELAFEIRMRGKSAVEEIIRKGMEEEMPEVGQIFNVDFLMSGISTSIKTGKFANACRTKESLFPLFAPEILEKLVINEEGSGEAEGTVTATAIMPDGQEKVLALIKHDGIWKVVGQADNKKAATELAIQSKKTLQERLILAKKRQENVAIFEKALQAQLEDGFTLLKNNDAKQAMEKLFTPLFMSTFSNAKTDSAVKSIALSEVLQNIDDLTNQSSRDAIILKLIDMDNALATIKKDTIEKSSVESLKTSSQLYKLLCAETIWKDGDIMVVKSSFMPKNKIDLMIKNAVNTGKEDEITRYRQKWLNAMDESDFINYSLLYKDDGIWNIAAHHSDEDIMIAFAKNYKDLRQEIQEIQKNQAKWEKEIQEMLAALQEAIKNKQADEIEKYIDIPSFLRNVGSLEDVAQAHLTYGENNADVKMFLQQVNEGNLGKYSHLSSIKEGSIEKLAKFYSLVKLINKSYVVIKREKDNDNWKIVQYGRHNENWERSGDWEKQVTIRIEEVKKALVNMQEKFTTISKAIGEAFRKKDSKNILQYIDVNALALFPAIETDVTLLKKTLEQIAPARPFMRRFTKAVTNGQPWPEVVDLWDSEAWEKAQFDFVSNKQKAVIGTLPTKNGERYVLFAPHKDSYKLILVPLAEKNSIIKEGEKFVLEWENLLANYNIDENHYDILELIDLLHNKQGKEFVKHINIPSMFFWSSYEDPLLNVENQAIIEHFQNDKIRNVCKTIEKEINTEGYFIYKDSILHPNFIEKGVVQHKDDTMLLIKYEDPFLKYKDAAERNIFFVKEDSIYKMVAIFNSPKKKSGLDAFFSSGISINRVNQSYVQRKEYIKNLIPKLIQPIASESCMAAVLDLLKVENIIYEVEKYDNSRSNSRKIRLRAKFILKNTHDKPITVNKWILYYMDEFSRLWHNIIFDTSRRITIEAKESIQMEELWALDEKSGYLMQEVVKGEMFFFTRPYQIIIENPQQTMGSFYTRYEGNGKIKDVGNGLWQLDDFPPIKPTAQRIALSKNAMRRLGTNAANYKQTDTPYTLTQAQAEGLDKAPAATEKQEQTSEEKAQDTATVAGTAAAAEEKDTVETKAVPIDTKGLVTPEPKKPGSALIIPFTQDIIGLNAFAADTKNDSCVRVLAVSASPLIGVRLENVGGTSASWKTKDAGLNALGVLAVQKDGTILNANDASFSLAIDKPTILDLIVQDNGAIADTKTRLRVVFFHKDGSRTYSIVTR